MSAPMSASLIGRFGSSAFRLSPPQCQCRSRARASLRNRHQGPSIMGFEDEVERSYGRPCRQTNGRSKQTCELTSSIVPRGTSCHRSVELEFPSIAFDLVRPSCRCGLGAKSDMKRGRAAGRSPLQWGNTKFWIRQPAFWRRLVSPSRVDRSPVGSDPRRP